MEFIAFEDKYIEEVTSFVTQNKKMVQINEFDFLNEVKKFVLPSKVNKTKKPTSDECYLMIDKDEIKGVFVISVVGELIYVNIHDAYEEDFFKFIDKYAKSKKIKEISIKLHDSSLLLFNKHGFKTISFHNLEGVYEKYYFLVKKSY